MIDEKRIRKSYEKAAEVTTKIKDILKNVINENSNQEFVFVLVHSLVVAHIFSDFLYLFSMSTKKFNLHETINEIVKNTLNILTETIEINEKKGKLLN